jgi:hypothetical protein
MLEGGATVKRKYPHPSCPPQTRTPAWYLVVLLEPHRLSSNTIRLPVLYSGSRQVRSFVGRVSVEHEVVEVANSRAGDEGESLDSASSDVGNSHQFQSRALEREGGSTLTSDAF